MNTAVPPWNKVQARRSHAGRRAGRGGSKNCGHCNEAERPCNTTTMNQVETQMCSLLYKYTGMQRLALNAQHGHTNTGELGGALPSWERTFLWSRSVALEDSKSKILEALPRTVLPRRVL